MCRTKTWRKRVAVLSDNCYKSGVSEIANQPYQPSFSSMAAVYRIEIGPFFYIGSSSKLGPRRSDHLRMLKEGAHPNHKLQAAWNAHQSAEVIVLQEVVPKKWDKSDDGTARGKHLEHLEIQKHFGSEFCCNLSNSAYHNTTIGDVMRERWKDPDFRQRMVEKLKARRGDLISPETRKKMADAKTGQNNPNARPCSLSFHGEVMKFTTGAAAADHFKVPQQVMDLWLRGKVPWPGKGMRSPRGLNKRLIGLTGRYLSSKRVATR
jgi:hypothetical protein